MAYSDFTIPELVRRFGLRITEGGHLFADVPPTPVPALLTALLQRYLPLALNQGTEKGRSELLIAPMLAELTLLYRDRLSFFSGIDFTVDPADGLSGRADFILARNPLQLHLTAPVCMLVEAKNEDILAGIPQCLAEMVAAQRYNLNAGVELSPLYGAVTTGFEWRFLRLEGTRATVDGIQYSIHTPERVFGVLAFMALGA